MIKGTMFSSCEDLQKLTGIKCRDGLWNAGFDLDDWDWGICTEEPLTATKRDKHSTWEENRPEAEWLIWKMESMFDCSHVEYGGKHYYMVYHS